MSTKGLFADRSAFTQLLVLLILVLVGSFLFSLMGMLILFLSHGLEANMLQHPDILRWIQMLSSIGTFLLPAIGMGWFCSTDIKKYLSIGKMPEASVILLVTACYFLLAPILNLSQFINQQISLPSFMHDIENWMRIQEGKAEEMTLILLADGDILTLLFNLVVIALTAGVAEEFLFRGALQRVIGGWSKNHHVVIWIAAILFSAIHMQFYGFFPRMFLGAYFGYLLYWSRNIWVPVFAHILNNTIVVIGMSNSNLKDNEIFNGELSNEMILPFSVVAVVFFLFFLGVVKRIKVRLNKEA